MVKQFEDSFEALKCEVKEGKVEWVTLGEIVKKVGVEREGEINEEYD